MAIEVAQIHAEIMAKMPKQEIRAEVDRIAKEGAELGRSIAPVLQEPHAGFTPGHFRDSIHAEEADDINGLPAARIISHSRVAHLLEFGTVTMPEHATFGQIAAHYGGTIDRVDSEGPVSEGRTIV